MSKTKWVPAATPEEKAERMAKLAELETRMARALGRRPNGDVSQLPADVQALPPAGDKGVGRKKTDKTPTDVYRLYDAGGELLYVGISLQVATRMGAHRHGGWWQDVAQIEIVHETTRAAALALEAELIAALKPRHNRARRSG